MYDSQINIFHYFMNTYYYLLYTIKFLEYLDQFNTLMFILQTYS